MDWILNKLGLDAPACRPFYVALGLFRSAAIAAGVYKRAFQGNASSANAKTLGTAPLKYHEEPANHHA